MMHFEKLQRCNMGVWQHSRKLAMKLSNLYCRILLMVHTIADFRFDKYGNKCDRIHLNDIFEERKKSCHER